ncbi:Elongated TPR repeat-containing domain-containing protein [Artemisia annua]|uniref:peptidylprolyl isomerase n=1 Tax=Artemisia annua TaxID=35608 RepID=A0A2U1KGZ0_ARTAN|nr:Elongated TPR repeat-containing domain-containing protein [Artemisia annua]
MPEGESTKRGLPLEEKREKMLQIFYDSQDFYLGWDEGIKTTKKGESALFTIPAELAYGESGSPPTILPNATLQFDVVKDICKDGGIYKKIVQKGEKWENPKDLVAVTVNYEVRLEDGTLRSASSKQVFVFPMIFQLSISDRNVTPYQEKFYRRVSDGIVTDDFLTEIIPRDFRRKKLPTEFRHMSSVGVSDRIPTDSN